MRTLFALAPALLLAACASGPLKSPSTSTSPSPAEGKAASPLVVEERWLREWFSGTPVEVGTQDDGALRVAVPLKHSFDSGKAKVLPPLGAVLDKVATSLRRQAGAKVEVAAPADGPGGAMAAERSTSVRDYLTGRGVRANRISAQSARTHLVEMRLLPPPAAIERLEDAPPPSAGARVTPPAAR